MMLGWQRQQKRMRGDGDDRPEGLPERSGVPRRPFITSLSIAKVHCLNICTRIRSVSLFLMVYKDIYVYEVNFNISVLKPFI